MMEPAVMEEESQEMRRGREDELSICDSVGKNRRSPADSRSRSLDDSDQQMLHDDQSLCPLSPLSPGIRSVSGYIENGGLLSPSGRLQSTSKSTASSTTSLCTDDSSYNVSMHNVMGYRERLPTKDLDRLILSDDVEPSEPSVSTDLEVRVDKPEKIMSTMDTYITFRVLTKTRRSDFMQSEYEVRRRYNDFVWLRQRLEQEYPMLLIPPLPEKHSVYSLDRFDPAFVKARCYLLHLFLVGLVVIPKLNRNEDLRLFLTADLQAWIMYRKSEHSTPRVTEALFAFATTRLLTSPDTEFQAYSAQCHELGQTVVAVEKLASKLNRTEQQEAQETAGL
uniref:PX domain-containing protein n=1 Tax=Plectus sambesii TaxID=2011161 RepID=A0A914XKR7_9BILA